MSDFSTSQLPEEAVMTDATRIAYLQAMGIDCWMPKSEQSSAEKVVDTHFEGKSESKNLEEESLNERVESTSQPKQPHFNNETEKNAPDKATQRVNEAIHSPSKNATENNENVVESNLKSNKFLKLVNWTNQNIREENSKHLLIICRHQIDQPANSFARQNSPSQFMLDYINALIGLINESSFELKVQLAHLSEAGLSKDSIPMDKVLDENNPDLILVLGDETAAHLLDAQADVASLRGRLVALGQNQKALVSYHPYSLITNSGLKSLALDDLTVLATYLMQNSQV